MAIPLGNVLAAGKFHSLRSLQQVLRILLPLVLVWVTWAMPAMAKLSKRYAITPERQALLNTIRHAEGTCKQGEDGYRVHYGGTLFLDVRRHPDKLTHGMYSSRAAGAYQFLPKTWEMAQKALRLRDFSPDSQDQAALYLIERRKALGLADRGVFTKELAHRLAPEWASFPKHSGHSYYGQPVRSFSSLKRFYDGNLKQQANCRNREPSGPSLAVAGPPPAIERQPIAPVARSRPKPTRMIPVATSADCNGELLCILDYVARGGVPIQPDSPISRS